MDGMTGMARNLELSRRRLLAGGLAALAAPALPAWAQLPSLPERDDLVGRLITYVSHADETLLAIARAHNVGVPQVSALNPGVDPWVPGDGTKLVLPTWHIIPDVPREGLIVNKADLRLYYFPKVGPMQHYAIGVGKEGFNTPIGPTRIVRKRYKPTWIPTAASINEKPWLPRAVLPGPDNPLGDYAMDFGFPGSYLVHSTNKPYGVGRRVSHGCIRMYPEGMERLFPQVALGSRAMVIDQAVKVGWHQGELYLQVMPSMTQIDELEATAKMSPEPPPPGVEQMVVAKAGTDLGRIDWDTVAETAGARLGIPVQVTRGLPALVGSLDQGIAGPAAPAAATRPAQTVNIHGIY
jgi:L,D-transpeptidase ErfK/SrfK